jgi:PPOX class probable FMN-dependent enzyme
LFALGLFESASAEENERMSDALWRPALVLALYQNRHAPDSRLVQLATVRADGRPANRTVVFRGFWNETAGLTFAADARSRKVGELGQSPWAEACWYFPITHEQFRISGPIEVIGADGTDDVLADARARAWRELAEPTRRGFAWPAPGRPRLPGEPFSADQPDPEHPLPHFCLLVLEPREVDYLEIDGNPQNRWAFKRGDGGHWSGTEINP